MTPAEWGTAAHIAAEAEAIRAAVERQVGIYVTVEQVVMHADGYAVTGLRRDAALLIGRAALGEFAADIRAGLPTVRVTADGDLHTVRIIIEGATS